MKKDIVYNLADGKGKVTRYTKKLKLGNFLEIEFGMLVLDSLASIGMHAHKDEDRRKHCEIYLTFSRNIFVNAKRRIASICRNSEHGARNISEEKEGKIFFLKLWW